MLPKKIFTLYAKVISWYDGDTFHGIVDQGFGDYKGTEEKPIRVRCALIQCPDDAPEEEQAMALEYAKTIAPAGNWYQCKSYKPLPDTYGRPLLDLVLPIGTETMFSRVMLDSGYAKLY